jgi:hydrogenase maturation protease
MNDVRVIGVGSPFGIDSLGWHVIHRLRRLPLPAAVPSNHIDFIEADRPGAHLIHLMQGAHYVILVDAILDSDRSGELIQLDRDQLIKTQKPISSHNLDVSDAIALADKLKLLPEKLSILGLSVNPSQENPPDETALNKLTQAVILALDAYFSEVLLA